MLVVASLSLAGSGWSLLSHTNCEASGPISNVTAWMPAAAVAAPYLGSESGSVTIWERTPLGAAFLTQQTSVADGNVSAYYVSQVNLSLYRLSNRTVVGPGISIVCLGPFVAYYAHEPAHGLASGGVTIWPLTTASRDADEGLPTQLNGSNLCREVENTSYQGCAVGTYFDMNFLKASGVVNMCGVPTSRIMEYRSNAWPVQTPFDYGGRDYSVPIDPTDGNAAGFSNGTYAWYNYTFPADGGVWQYDDLQETSPTGAGLVFRYSPCPQPIL